MFVPPINAIFGVETDKLWILVESLSKSKWDETITLDLSHALACEFSPSTT
jgi:hypothetical protein